MHCFAGNSPITGYLLRLKKRSSSTWETRTITTNNSNADAEQLVLSDLEANTQYNVQVKAQNIHGYETGIGSFSTMKTVKTAERD